LLHFLPSILLIPPRSPLFPYTTLFRSEIADDIIGLFLWRAIVALRGALDVNPVFVGAGKKKRLNTLLSLLTGNRVRYDHRVEMADRKSTRLNSSHGSISYAVFCLKKNK